MADDILREALDAFADAQSKESHNRTKALDDLKFARIEGNQWPEKVRKQREADGRPCIEVNKLPAFIRQVVNDSRQNKPGISVHPVEDGDEKTAEVMSGLIRAIETQSNADVAYDTAVDFSATMGFGYIRINLDYACDDTFDQDIVIKPVPNPFAIYGDPNSQCADSSDWMTGFIIDQMSEAAFKRKYPKAKEADFGSGAWEAGWCDTAAKSARVAEYWKRSEVVRQLVQYQVDGQPDIRVGYEDELGQLQKQFGSIALIPDARRAVKTYRVKQYVLTANEILSELDWAGRYIPIIPVYGEEVNVEGRRHFRSLIRDAKGPQQMFNFFRTNAAEIVGYAPRAPWVGRKGAFDSDPKWQTANNATHAFLEYDGTEAPTRTPFNGMSPGDIQEAMNASDDMKAVMGIYDASLGARSNETSGRAIMARQREGDVSTFHFIDNLSRAIRHTGKVLIDLIPKVYNQERMIRILGQDNKAQTVRLTDDKDSHNPDAGIYNLTLGKYDLVVKTGPSFTTQREEAANMLTELIRANGELAPIVGDQIIENLDIPGGDVIVKRLQAMLPPQIKAAEDGQNPEAQAAQQAMQQQAQQFQQIMADMQKALQEAEAKAADNSQKAENDSRKVDIEAYKAVTERMTTAMQAGQMTPEMVQQLVVDTLRDVFATSEDMPEDQGDTIPMAAMAMGSPAPMQPDPGQAEGPFAAQ